MNEANCAVASGLRVRRADLFEHALVLCLKDGREERAASAEERHSIARDATRLLDGALRRLGRDGWKLRSIRSVGTGVLRVVARRL